MNTSLIIGIVVLIIIVIIIAVVLYFYLRGGSTDMPAITPANIPAETPADTPANTPADTPANTPVDNSVRPIADDNTVKWSFYPRMDSPGGDDINLSMNQGRHLIGQVNKLIELANAHPQIVAFNTDGWMKTSLKPQTQWKSQWQHPTRGLYVRE